MKVIFPSSWQLNLWGRKKGGKYLFLFIVLSDWKIVFGLNYCLRFRKPKHSASAFFLSLAIRPLFSRLSFKAARFVFMYKKLYFCVVFWMMERKIRWKTTRTTDSNMYWRSAEKLLQICGTISKENGEYHWNDFFLSFYVFLLASEDRNNKLPFLCFRPPPTLAPTATRAEKKQSKGKFNQVIKHSLLKHQLNLMGFLLPLLLYVGESLF